MSMSHDLDDELLTIKPGRQFPPGPLLGGVNVAVRGAGPPGSSLTLATVPLAADVTRAKSGHVSLAAQTGLVRLAGTLGPVLARA